MDVCVFLFDLLYLDGQGMLQSSFRQRRQALFKLFGNLRPGYVEMARGFELEVHEAGGTQARPVPADPNIPANLAVETQTTDPLQNSAASEPAEVAEAVTESSDATMGILTKLCVVCTFRQCLMVHHSTVNSRQQLTYAG